MWDGKHQCHRPAKIVMTGLLPMQFWIYLFDKHSLVFMLISTWAKQHSCIYITIQIYIVCTSHHILRHVKSTFIRSFKWFYPVSWCLRKMLLTRVCASYTRTDCKKMLIFYFIFVLDCKWDLWGTRWEACSRSGTNNSCTRMVEESDNEDRSFRWECQASTRSLYWTRPPTHTCNQGGPFYFYF